VRADIGAADYGAVLQGIADNLVATAAPIPCEWTIPAPPAGRTLDPDQVNVRYRDHAGREQTIYAVNAADDCERAGGGWYYDDAAAPTRILTCASTCSVLELDPQAEIEVSFGCERLIAPPLL
jgi:hypothetical protein